MRKLILINPAFNIAKAKYARFGAQSFSSAVHSTASSSKFLKICFSLICKLRWKARFFKWPIEYKLAKRFVTSS